VPWHRAPGLGVLPRINDVADTFRTPKRRADRAGPHMSGGTLWRLGGGTVPPSNLATVEPDLNTSIIHGAARMSTSATTDFTPYSSFVTPTLGGKGPRGTTDACVPCRRIRLPANGNL
jgi:hypothetical protein